MKEKFFEDRQTNVEKFLKSYLIQKKLEEIPGIDEEDDCLCSVEPCCKNPYDSHLEAGQIRVLSHTERVTYILLLQRWEEDSFVIMPFSEYNWPATDEEYKVEEDGGLMLRVLQAWNVRTLQDKTLRKSWTIGNISENDLNNAIQCWKYSLGYATLSDAIVKRIGLPVYRKDDLRLKYKHEELQNFARVDAEDLENLESSILYLASYDDYEGEEDISMAAASKKENLQFTYTIEGMDVTCFIEYSRHDKALTFIVYDDNGKKSNLLDGYQVWDASKQNIFGVLHEGELHIPCESPEKMVIRIADAEGNEVDGVFQEE